MHQLGLTFKLWAYADDLLILIEGQSRAELERRGDESIRIVCDWGTQVDAEVAIDKTVMILLKDRLSNSLRSSIRIGENCIRYVTDVRYL